MNPFSITSFVRGLEDKATRIVGSSVLGIDIGSASIKLVQLAVRDGVPAVETYGEIETGPYGNQKPRKAVSLEWKVQADALSSLMHEVETGARRAIISAPLSSTLISIVKMPKRDDEQMKHILPIEAQRYIPVPLNTVLLDWVVLGDGEEMDAIARAESDATVKVQQLQDVMLIAVDKKVAAARESAARAADLVVGDLLEVEMFSAARSCKSGLTSGPELLADLGASSSKLYVVNGRGIPVAAHAVPFGGEALTERLMEALGYSFEKAEDAKRESGFQHLAGLSEKENTTMSKALAAGLAPLIDEMKRVIEHARTVDSIDISHATLVGGGALLKGLPPYAAHALGIEVTLGEPFSNTRLPMMLEDVAHAVGPRYAVAIGLALRGLQHS